MLTQANTYREVCQAFSWRIPEYYNIGVDICDKHTAVKNRTALIYETEDGAVKTYTFDDFIKLSNQFANALYAAGIKRGDRVGILLPQCPETAIVHIATYKIGGIAIPKCSPASLYAASLAGLVLGVNIEKLPIGFSNVNNVTLRIEDDDTDRHVV